MMYELQTLRKYERKTAHIDTYQRAGFLPRIRGRSMLSNSTIASRQRVKTDPDACQHSPCLLPSLTVENFAHVADALIRWVGG